ncbi:MAG TPA: L-threonylcarbamoyladenylate synthase [Methanoregulaceae archaeon]|nr:L-threonylcarbamoyladenylate synthase [Methanoregulaceae archaeon]
MDIIRQAVKVLNADGLVVYPTETVYGLGGDALSDDAIQKVYEAKGRLISKPISIAVSDFEMLCAVGRIGVPEEDFISRFLPGPVTIVVRARSSVPDILTGGTGMIGIRYPDHPLALQLISEFDSPVTATSANQSGAKDPVTPDECHVLYDILIDGGRLPGTPSTVVDLVNRIIIRNGAISSEIAQWLSGLE